ncbi:hypothetical protein NKH77_02745 [Streptomyces sp. M19]
MERGPCPRILGPRAQFVDASAAPPLGPLILSAARASRRDCGVRPVNSSGRRAANSTSSTAR